MTVPVVGAIALAAAVVVTVTPGEQPVAAQGEQGEQTGPGPAAPLAAGPAVPGGGSPSRMADPAPLAQAPVRAA
ncbi:hypothetical protein, partial [Pseudonocardia sp. McavD-2-B]